LRVAVALGTAHQAVAQALLLQVAPVVLHLVVPVAVLLQVALLPGNQALAAVLLGQQAV